MAKHDIIKSQHLLKRLEEEMMFLNSLLAQMESLSVQVAFVSSGAKKTWIQIYNFHKDWERDQEEPFFREGFKDESSHP